MEKTLTIDGKEVTFKSTAGVPIRYKNQFGRDLFNDLMKLVPLTKMDKNVQDMNEKQLQKVMSLLDYDLFYNILWTMAKTADKSIPQPLDWLDEFEEFPLNDIFPQVQDLLNKSLQTSKKK